jgi:predicted RNA polymerase sigma factor
VEEADHAYELAIGLESDPAVRRFLELRRDAIKAQ